MPISGDTFKIFVGNLSNQTTGEDLRNLFEEHGTVVESDVLKNFGFVHMQTDEARRAAINALNGYHLHGKDIAVQTAKGGRPGPGGNSRSNTRTKIYIGNLHKDATAKDLRELFEEHGKVNEADVLGNYGFVHMDAGDDARRAIEALDGTELRGLRMAVQESTSRSEKRTEQSNKIYVGNLHKDTTSNDIREMFEAYGQVDQADVLGNFAFVHMSSEDDARNAIESLDGTELHGLRVQVQVSKSKNRQVSDKDACFNCGGRGHWSKECPRGDGRRGGGGGGGGRFDSYGGPPRGYDRDRMMRGMRDDPYDRYSRYGDDPYARRPLPPMHDDLYDRRPLPPMRDDPYDRRPMMSSMRDDPYDRRLPPMDMEYMRYGRRSRSPPPRMGSSYGRFPPPPPAPMRGYERR